MTAVDAPFAGPSPPLQASCLTGCLECGTLQHLPAADEHSRFACVTCKSLLEQTKGRSSAAALACALATFLLLFPANFEPFLSTAIFGVSRTSHLASSAGVMLSDGWPLLAGFVFLFVVALPFVRFGLLSLVLGCLQVGRRPPWLGKAFRYANALQTWAMPDVFLLSLAVAYARLASSIPTHVELGARCFIVAGTLALFTRALLNKPAVWREIAPEWEPAGDEPTLSCTTCERLSPLSEAHRPCPRCGAHLTARRPHSVMIAAALTLGALIFYVPANLLPLATLPIGVTPTKYTVLQGVIDLVQANLMGLAILVFCASFAIPFLKLGAMGWCLSSVARRSNRNLVTKTRLYRLVEEIGRWSMVDPFVIGCFTPVMNYNAFIYGRAEAAATPFALVVVLTVLASKMFDPRLMWDVAQPRPDGRRLGRAL